MSPHILAKVVGLTDERENFRAHISELFAGHGTLALCSANALIDLAAAYTAGILRNHPFVDGNKRTGFVIGVLFLEMNGYRFVASEESATQAILGLASGALEESEFVAWLRGNATAVRGQRRKRKRK